jgi:hypothetical protein
MLGGKSQATDIDDIQIEIWRWQRIFRKSVQRKKKSDMKKRNLRNFHVTQEMIYSQTCSFFIDYEKQN